MLEIDHVTIAGPDLAALEAKLAGTGLRFSYGGAHSNGVTHMSLASFEDGSYVELISTLEPGREAPIWSRYISGSGGPCAWAVGLDDVGAEAVRLRALGVQVRGPFYMHRRRPDGVLVEWDLAYVGEGDPGATLPFVIKDRTPRELRVPPAEPAEGPGRLTGVAAVVLAVPDLGEAIRLFRRVYGLDEPLAAEDDGLGAWVAWFEGTPVVLAAPGVGSGWLTERLDRFGPSPCAFLLGTDDVEAAARRLGLDAPEPWLGRSVAWLELDGVRLGVAA
jgi:hypothetical protein